MESHSVTCHPAAVTLPPLLQPKLVLDLSRHGRTRVIFIKFNIAQCISTTLLVFLLWYNKFYIFCFRPAETFRKTVATGVSIYADSAHNFIWWHRGVAVLIQEMRHFGHSSVPTNPSLFRIFVCVCFRLCHVLLSFIAVSYTHLTLPTNREV